MTGLTPFLKNQGTGTFRTDAGKTALGPSQEGFEQLTQLSWKVKHMSTGTVKLLDNFIHRHIKAKQKRHQAASGRPHGGLIFQVDPVVKGELGKHFHRLFVLIKTDDDIDRLLVLILDSVSLGVKGIRKVILYRSLL